MFDGSSIAGWKAINESDMKLMLDANTATIDPFFAATTLNIVCDVVEPLTDQPYERDPRSIAKKAEAYLKQTKIGDTVYFGPEAEFFVFDDVRYSAESYNTGFVVDDIELPTNSATEYEMGNLGHRIRKKMGYFPVPPQDSLQDMRSEMLSAMASMGVKVEKHHHEVASAQHELGMKFGPLVTLADHLQIYKYCIHNVANSYGKTATFMPKPIYGDNGSGMHVHQSIWKGGKPLFAGKQYADLSDECLYYIGGIIKHAKSLNGFTNPLTNSYKRLVPGFEAPVLLAYSSRNRSASCRIPVTNNPKAKRVEVRFPDPGANPYLAFASMLMAGLDGIKNKIHPGEAMDKNLYDLPPRELKRIPTVCGSLREALGNLDKDRDYLKAGDVFTDDMIDSYIELKMEDVIRFEHTPHPVEYEMYYSV
jgi:glutamine synthetase